jgi:hypothetical protein
MPVGGDTSRVQQLTDNAKSTDPHKQPRRKWQCSTAEWCCANRREGVRTACASCPSALTAAVNGSGRGRAQALAGPRPWSTAPKGRSEGRSEGRSKAHLEAPTGSALLVESALHATKPPRPTGMIGASLPPAAVPPQYQRSVPAVSTSVQYQRSVPAFSTSVQYRRSLPAFSTSVQYQPQVPAFSTRRSVPAFSTRRSVPGSRTEQQCRQAVTWTPPGCPRQAAARVGGSSRQQQTAMPAALVHVRSQHPLAAPSCGAAERGGPRRASLHHRQAGDAINGSCLAGSVGARGACAFLRNTDRRSLFPPPVNTGTPMCGCLDSVH